MTVIRRTSRPADHYTTIANSALRDTRLSRGARGLLAELLSHEVGWSTTIRGLAAAGPEGKDYISKYVAELKKFGYLSLAQDRADGGTFGSSIWDVTDEPERQGVVTTPHPVSPDTVSPDPAKPPLKKNNKQEDQHHSHHTDSVGAVDKSTRMFKLTPNRKKALNDVLTECGVSYAIPQWNAYIRTVDFPTGQDLMRRWFGIREAMRHGDRNRRDELNSLLALAGVADVSDEAWQKHLASTGGSDGTLRLDF